MNMAVTFSDGDLVVYPNHGIGRLERIEKQQIAGQELQVLVINFQKNRMTLRLPLTKATLSGLRSLSSVTDIEEAMATLSKRVKATKGIWARRAQEYELKINSGNLTLIAEVIRELHRADNQAEQSYSERQLYQAALERLASEVAAVEDIPEDQVIQRVEAILQAA
jgi:CarD family transcriptional regulator